MAPAAQRDALARSAAGAKRIPLNAREAADFEMIGIGAMSPLEGFMGSADLDAVVHKCRLASGTVWPLAVTLSSKGVAVKAGETAALVDENDKLLGLIEVSEVYDYDVDTEAQGTLGTPACSTSRDSRAATWPAGSRCSSCRPTTSPTTAA